MMDQVKSIAAINAQGRAAAQSGHDANDCPYARGTDAAVHWRAGFDVAQYELSGEATA